MLLHPLQPLSPLPGQGLVALIFCDYVLCNNDPYSEVSIAEVIRRPGARGSHLLKLRDSMRSDSFHAHVLALPVDSGIARVRGVYGYQLPKWLAPISLRIEKDVIATIAGPNGTPDLARTAPLPPLQQVPSQSRIGTSTMINRVVGVWHQSTILSNKLSFGQTTLPPEVTLERAGDPPSQVLNWLGATRMLRFDVVKDIQIVLNMLVPLTATPAAGW